MRIVTFRNAGSAPEAGIIVDDKVVGLSGAGFGSVIELIAGGDAALSTAESFARGTGSASAVALSGVTLLSPVPRPSKFICVGLNYRDHAIESKMEIPEVPTIFNKFPNVVIGPNEPIVLPKVSEKPDYEAELAVVIGRGGRAIKADNWEQHVFGYTIVNDVSARDYQLRTSQWLMGKTFDTFAP
ncbi:MAG TPA: fumarylacetoacetate hydrolase family protein, partial [Bryobacteraceae bacterium]|nr:fumarylacetoacetate hydrolase family protein [Bryobacteraceae bacterium]